jgi:hypothetical protein
MERSKYGMDGRKICGKIIGHGRYEIGLVVI